MNPYRETVDLYRNSFWRGTLPLPHKAKNPPPTGYTGHRAAYPDDEKIKEWKTDGKRHNICIRLAGVDREKKYEIIGIDVDHYKSGDKDKKGGDQLKELEANLGALPDTWISSSRDDGISGIRYFLVPRGLAFRGQIAKDIECISKGYRFAVVWPSVHPEGKTYWWFPPGTVPDERGRSVWDGVLPNAQKLPLLPDNWLEYLTQNKMRAEVDDRIDMDSSVDEVYQWADDTFHGEQDDEPCRLLSKKLAMHVANVEDEATLHDKITNAHYNIFRLAAEGHVGWVNAINTFDKAAFEKGVSIKGRSPDEIKGELFRSRINGLRKVKAQCDERVKIGAAAVDACCQAPGGVCDEVGRAGDVGHAGGSDDGGDDGLADIPRGALKPPGEYRLNDDGNAEHFVDMYSSLETGPAVRYVDGQGWIIWHLGKEDETPHWQVDRDGDQQMRLMFQKVRDRQEDYVENALRPDYLTKLQQFTAQTPGVSKADVEVAKAKYLEWKKFAQINGNNRNAENAIKAVKSIPGVTVSVNELDRNPLLLGVANGVVELGNDDAEIRPAKPSDLITLNTHVSYGEVSKLSAAVWENYLNTFLPDPSLRQIVQIVLGHCLIGGNPEKILLVLKGGTDTGKSTMLSAIESALGDYAAPVNETVFQASHFSEVLTESLNKRVVVCSEFDASIKLSGSIIKRLTGNDKVTQAIKHSNAVRTGHPQFVMVLATNNTPEITGADKALQNRLFVIPFETRPDHIDRSQQNAIAQVCAPAVLWWLIEGYKQYRTVGLPTSQIIEDKVEEFMAELDHVAMFLSEVVTKHSKWNKNIDWRNDPEWCVKRDTMHMHYKQWCDLNEIPIHERLTPHMFTKRLRALGLLSSEGNRTVRIGTEANRWWYGVKLRRVRANPNVVAMPKMIVETVTKPGSDTGTVTPPDQQ